MAAGRPPRAWAWRAVRSRRRRRTCAECKGWARAPPSASWLSGGFSRRQIVPQAARSLPQPGPITRQARPRRSGSRTCFPHRSVPAGGPRVQRVAGQGDEVSSGGGACHVQGHGVAQRGRGGPGWPKPAGRIGEGSAARSSGRRRGCALGPRPSTTPSECRAALGRQARPEEACVREPCWVRGAGSEARGQRRGVRGKRGTSPVRVRGTGSSVLRMLSQ